MTQTKNSTEISRLERNYALLKVTCLELAMGICDAMAAQVNEDKAVIKRVVRKHKAAADAAQDAVNQTREAFGKNYVSNATGSDEESVWDSEIEASSVGDVSFGTDMSSEA